MLHPLRFIGLNRDTKTAGPGKRLEFFTKGCIRGVLSPCQGCFNESTWTFAGNYRELSIGDVVDICNETAWNRQVTFCGGEPILQARSLGEAARRLKEIDPSFHFVMYTAYKLDTLMKHGLQFTWLPRHGAEMRRALEDYSASSQGYIKDGVISKIVFTILTKEDVLEFMKYIDIIVDGDYKHELRLTTSLYMHEGWFIGSSNQRVINAPASAEGVLDFIYADVYNKMRSESVHCDSCGHILDSEEQFCDDVCQARFDEHSKTLEGVI